MTHKTPKPTQRETEQLQPARQPYTAPKLVTHGKVEDLTKKVGVSGADTPIGSDLI
jgi:hypothetical protein